MGEFASKGVAGAALGLGIAGTALGLLNGGGNGLLGGLLGGWGNGAALAGGTALGVIAEKDARIAMLESENYADKVGKDTYAQSLADNRATEDRINAILKPTAEAIAANQTEIAVLKMQIQKDKEITQLKIDNCCCKTNAKIDAVAQAATCGIQQNSAAIAALQAVVGKITQTIIPQDAICPPVMPRYNSWTAPTGTGGTTPAA